MNQTLKNVKPGDKVTFVTGPGHFPDLPNYQGIAYGKKVSRWGVQLRVKVTDDSGNVTWHYVDRFVTVGIGAYYMGS